MSIMWNRHELREKLNDHGFRPTKSRGQNFMTDRNFLSFIVEKAGVDPGDTVVEIGTGAGHLTRALLDADGRVLGAEIDSELTKLTREHTGDPDELFLFEGDVLDGDHLDADYLSFLETHLDGEEIQLVSNLPYRRGVKLLIALVEADLPFTEGHVVLQKQLAEKLEAEGGTSSYGASSVLFQWHAKLKRLRSVAKQVFWPEPEVPSDFCRITFEGWVDIDSSDSEYEKMKEVVDVLFRHPRKTLRNNLKLSDAFTPEEADIYEDFLHDLFLKKRPEQATPQEWYELTKKLIERE